MDTHASAHGTTTTARAGEMGETTRLPDERQRELTANDILQRIDMLIGETAYLRESLEALARIESRGTGDAHGPGDIGTQAKAQAIASVIEHRELTNQKLITLLDRMYGDLAPTAGTRRYPRTPEEMKLIERLIDQSPEMSEDTLRAFLESVT